MSQTSTAALIGPAVSTLQQQLQNSPYWSLRQLICQMDQGRVVLRGTVPCYFLKQVAQSLAAKTIGVERFCSDIEVRCE